MITQEEWMDLLSYRQMVAAGASWAEIARLAGCDWRTARKYLSAERKRPPRYKPRPPRPKLIDPYLDLIDAELRASKAQIHATTVHERLASDHGYRGSYQRVKEYVRARRPEIAAELGLRTGAEMHRRFEVAPGAQAQVDWDDVLAGLLVRFAAAGVPVARRDIAAYDELFAVGGAR